jgi:hypothetical protein
VFLVELKDVFYRCTIEGHEEEKVAPFREFDYAVVVGVYRVEEGVEDGGVDCDAGLF